MTNRLHTGDLDRDEFAARVVDVADRAIVLDQTYFFGPHRLVCSDTGSIGAQRVVGLRRTRCGTLGHVVTDSEEPLPSAGDVVECHIDGLRRYRLRQLHTAQHLMEHAAEATNELRAAAGGPVTPDSATIALDFDGTGADLSAVTDWFAAAVRDDYSCGVTSSPAPPFGQLWHLDGYGVRQCDAIHLPSTGGIGGVRYVATSTGPSRACVELWVDTPHSPPEAHDCRGYESRTDVAADHRPRYTGRSA
ncbi:MAG: hypothetical protein OEV40_19830 [Acidimicrobiia bacterium]|nr:hypothetical protein [Acidimicrobiia bacterium]